MPLIPALGRQRQANFWVRGQPGLQSELQENQGYTEKPCLEKTKPNQTNQTTTTNKQTNKKTKKKKKGKEIQFLVVIVVLNSQGGI
jgi:flagellar biosynthesis/type III secretory pathway M-ring protein FliF/YscJ